MNSGDREWLSGRKVLAVHHEDLSLIASTYVKGSVLYLYSSPG